MLSILTRTLQLQGLSTIYTTPPDTILCERGHPEHIDCDKEQHAFPQFGTRLREDIRETSILTYMKDVVNSSRLLLSSIVEMRRYLLKCSLRNLYVRDGLLRRVVSQQMGCCQQQKTTPSNVILSRPFRRRWKKRRRCLRNRKLKH